MELPDVLLSDPGYQQARSPAARRKAIEMFLVSRADGFSPPTHVREELYARTQERSKTRKVHGPGVLPLI